ETYIQREYDEMVSAFLKEYFLSNDEPVDLAIQALESWLRKHIRDTEALVRLARFYVKGQVVEKGIRALRALIETGNKAPWVVRSLADLYAQSKNRSAAAEEAYARAIAGGVATDRALLALAEVYAGKKRVDPLAAEVYHRATGIEGCPPVVKICLAEIYFSTGAYEDAASLCREVLRRIPDHEDALRLEARSLLKAGHVEGALDRLWMAYKNDANDIRATEDLAEALAAKGDTTSDAVSVYENYLTLARKGTVKVDLEAGWAVMKTLGVAHFRGGGVDKGLSILKALYSKETSRPAGERMASEVGGDIPDASALRLGTALMELGDFSRTKPLLIRGLKTEPARLPIVLKSVRAARAAFPDQLGQAIDLCDNLREVIGDDPQLIWVTVEGYLAAGDVDEGAIRTRQLLGPGEGPDPEIPESLLKTMQEQWMQVIAKGNESASALYIQGRLRLALQEPGEALTWFKRARALDTRDRHVLESLKRTYRALIDAGGDEEHREKLADLLVEVGEMDEAIPIFQSISEEYSRRREVIAKLAKCFLEKGHPLIASKNLERALGEEEVSDASAEIFYILADAYEAAGDLRKAKITFEKIGFWNYGYRDVRNRLADLGKLVAPTPSTPVTPSPLSPVSERRTIGGLDTAELPVGKVEGGRFEILDLRGRGGMAMVYKALDHEFDPPLLVALKVLPEDFAYREKAVRLLKREASAAIQLTHPGIVRIFSTGEEQGKRYISMEYIEGPDLATIMDRKGALPHAMAEKFFRETLEALGYAHQMGVIHKDIKPSNIMLTEDTPSGRVKITDFGIARIVTDQIGFSRTLSVRGTLPYMSPQQIAGEQADAQSDIYSLGVTVYEMLVGDPPFMRGDVAYQHTYKAPAPLSENVKDVPPHLESVVMRCLEKKLVARYKSTEEILADLAKGEGQGGVDKAEGPGSKGS
ncbi:MAG: protein kinase domain-containing protein, partial [Planctomycetota bacterium]